MVVRSSSLVQKKFLVLGGYEGSFWVFPRIDFSWMFEPWKSSFTVWVQEGVGLCKVRVMVEGRYFFGFLRLFCDFVFWFSVAFLGSVVVEFADMRSWRLGIGLQNFFFGSLTVRALVFLLLKSRIKIFLSFDLSTGFGSWFLCSLISIEWTPECLGSTLEIVESRATLCVSSHN